MFRILFPITATCLVALPFAGDRFTNAVAAVSYAIFMLATVLMMMHCAQISRDSGINPLFIYAFYGLVAYACQMLGYAAGGASHTGFDLGVEQLSLVSLFALFAMLMLSLFGRRPYPLHTDRLEFLTPAPRGHGESSPTASASAEHSDSHPSETGHLANASRATSLGASAHAAALDLTAQRCRLLAKEYGLSSRETEVAELIARGYTGPAIAEALFISENTMRTHNRRIYAKLGIHKKQELLSLLEGISEPL